MAIFREVIIIVLIREDYPRESICNFVLFARDIPDNDIQVPKFVYLVYIDSLKVRTLEEEYNRLVISPNSASFRAM
jgi:hypothetical protein